jgi:hypothetical protein
MLLAMQIGVPEAPTSSPIDQKCVAGRNCLKALDQSSHNSVYPQAYPPQLGIKGSTSEVRRGDFTNWLGLAGLPFQLSVSQTAHRRNCGQRLNRNHPTREALLMARSGYMGESQTLFVDLISDTVPRYSSHGGRSSWAMWQMKKQNC